MANVAAQYQSAFIFGGKDAAAIRNMTKALGKIPALEQRMIFLWCLNRATGSWKTCRRCLVEEGTKHHLESCVLRLQGQCFGPSQIEDAIFLADPDPAIYSRIAQQILECIGERPHE